MFTDCPAERGRNQVMHCYALLVTAAALPYDESSSSRAASQPNFLRRVISVQRNMSSMQRIGMENAPRNCDQSTKRNALRLSCWQLVRATAKESAYSRTLRALHLVQLRFGFSRSKPRLGWSSISSQSVCGGISGGNHRP